MTLYYPTIADIDALPLIVGDTCEAGAARAAETPMRPGRTRIFRAGKQVDIDCPVVTVEVKEYDHLFGLVHACATAKMALPPSVSRALVRITAGMWKNGLAKKPTAQTLTISQDEFDALHGVFVACYRDRRWLPGAVLGVLADVDEFFR